MHTAKVFALVKPLRRCQFRVSCWEVLTAKRLDTMRRDISAEEAERFFDGAEPDWAFALCHRAKLSLAGLGVAC